MRRQQRETASFGSQRTVAALGLGLFIALISLFVNGFCVCLCLLSLSRALNVLADAGAKLNVQNRLGICPVDAAKGEALKWLQERGFSPDLAMVQLMLQQEAMEKETLSSGTKTVV